MKKLTPAQQQYVDIKKNYQDAILFFRMGDFYEVFYDDAKICAKVLDIALTSRDKNSDNPIPMAGIPYHSVEKYLPKLLEAGYKVAIAEQIGEVVPWKVVERKVTQVITPWTYVKEQKNENNILAIYEEKWKFYITWADISTGIFYIQDFENIDDLKEAIFKIFPKETILPLNIEYKDEIEEYIWKFINPYISHYNVPFLFKEKIQSYLVSSMDSYWKALDTESKQKVLAMFLDYLESLNISFNILKVKYQEKEDFIYFDSLTIKNLEIFQSSYDQDKKHSLFSILDNTITWMGSRMLKNWLLHPLNNVKKINKRLEGFGYFIDISSPGSIKSNLKEVYDIERLSYLILFKQNSPFHWLKLKISLNAIYEISEIIKNPDFLNLSPDLNRLRQTLNAWLKDGDFTLEKDFIQDNFSQKVDELRKLAYHSDQMIIDYQQELVEKLKIPVRIKYVNNQGYLIEVSKKDVKVFEEKFQNILNSQTLSEKDSQKFSFTRKQTLKIAERYISPYLKQLEQKAISALYELQEEEKQILEQWKQDLQKLSTQIEELAQKVGQLDIFVSLWEFFENNNYTAPEFKDEWEINIVWGRHSVIEKFLAEDESFIENNLEMGFDPGVKKNSTTPGSGGLVHIITWPNMGWKSTYLRQNALILLLAHCGLYVPAKKCQTPVLSWIFARVGSWDVLVKNQSTFMTEMVEVANILNNADEKSFIIFDELGRWTSTYDGMAISQAVIEYIVEKLKAKTLFATHYHELIKLEKKYPWKIKNFSVAVYENEWNIIFMKKIMPGGADKSYGIYVAQLAGLPKEIIDKSKEIEKQLDKSCEEKKVVVQSLFDMWDAWMNKEEQEKAKKYEKLKESLENLDIYNTTPIKALEILEKLRNGV